MQYGTVYGHGAYLGPDFTADYLHREALHMKEHYGGDEAARARVRRELQANRYDPAAGTLIWTEGQVSAFEAILGLSGETFLDREASGAGLKPAPDRRTPRSREGRRLHRLDGLDGLGPSARQDVLLHQ